MTVGEQIRAYRLAKGLSLVKLAELIGVDAACICRWERGGGMTIHTLERICKALGVTVIIG